LWIMKQEKIRIYKMEVPKAYQFLYKQYVELYNRPLPVETVHERFLWLESNAIQVF